MQDVYGLRYAIAKDKLPVVLGVSWYQSGMSDAAARTGVIPVPTKGDKNVGGHALECDGYDFRNTAHPTPVFDGPNSWGDDWGDHGGYRMPLAIVQSSDSLNDVWVLTDAARAAA